MRRARSLRQSRDILAASAGAIGFAPGCQGERTGCSRFLLGQSLPRGQRQSAVLVSATLAWVAPFKREALTPDPTDNKRFLDRTASPAAAAEPRRARTSE